MSIKRNKLVILLFAFFPLMSFGQGKHMNVTSLSSKIVSLDVADLMLGQPPVHYIVNQTKISLTDKSVDLYNSDFSDNPIIKERKTDPKNIISLKFGADDPWIGIVYERLLIKYVGMEVQIGLIGASAGAKIYYPGNKSGGFNFHVGVQPAWGFATGRATYFPIGINYLTKNNFRISLDGGPRIWHDEPDNFPGFSLKIGKAF